MIKTVGKKFGRAYHFDFHTSPGIKNILGNFDAEKFADQLVDAHIEIINMAARCNMGYSYYNTKVGKKYEGLGDRDPLAEIINACHKRGIDVVVYINVGLDHEIAADHPEWLKVDRAGRIHGEDKKDNFFRMMCVNSPYREHFLSEIRELSEYDIDGLFIDCFRLTPCFCPRCLKAMEGAGVDISSDKAVLDYQNALRYALAEDAMAALGDKRGRIKTCINGMSFTSGFNTHAEVECLTGDPQWGYDFFDSASAYMRTNYEDLVFMSARFQNSWGDFGGLKPLASMQNDLYDAMMNGFGISFGDHLHPVDGFESEVARRVKAVMEERIAYEPYVADSKYVAEIGVLIHSGNVARRLQPFVKGVTRMLKELKLTYNIYDENGDFDDSSLRLLIVGEDCGYDEQVCVRLKKYVERGGKIIFAGSGIDVAERAGLMGFAEHLGEDKMDNAYFTLDGSDMRWAMYNTSRLVKNISGKELSRYAEGVVNFVWDGRQSCYYRPQGEITELSAAVADKNVGLICFDIFGAYAECFLVEQRALLEALIDELLPERLIRCVGMPKTAAVSLTKKDDMTVLHVKSTYPEHKMARGIIEEHTYMKSASVSVEGEWQSVCILPDMTPVESRIENGRTCFETGDVLGYRAFLLK